MMASASYLVELDYYSRARRFLDSGCWRRVADFLYQLHVFRKVCACNPSCGFDGIQVVRPSAHNSILSRLALESATGNVGRAGG